MPVIRRETLTKAAVESAKANDSAYRLWDAKVTGLCLRVLPSGIKTFEMHLGRNVSQRLGRYPGMTLEAARNAAQKAQGAFSEHGADAKAKRPKTFGAFLIEDYEPWVTAERKAGVSTMLAIRSVWSELLNKPLTDISAWVVEKTKAARLKAGIKPATVNRDLGRIRAALAKAVEWKLLSVHPLTQVKLTRGADEGRIRFLSDKEEKALRKALDAREKHHRTRRESGIAWRTERGRDVLPSIGTYFDHLTPMAILALNTGLRRGELTSLTWNDIDLQSKLLTVRAGYSKSQKARHIPLNSEAIDVLKRYRKQHSGEGRLFDVFSVKKSWSTLMTNAGVSNFRFHDLRHTFASKLVAAGVDLNTVRELLGHADIRMTLRYAHLAPEHKAAAVEKLVR